MIIIFVIIIITIMMMIIIIITCDGGSEENPDDDEYPSVGAKAVLAVCFDPSRTEQVENYNYGENLGRLDHNNGDDDFAKHDDDGDLCLPVMNGILTMPWVF